jgi:hypothetical protein
MDVEVRMQNISKLLILLTLPVFLVGCQTGSGLADPGEADSTPLSTPIPDTSNQQIATPDRMDPSMAKTPERVPPTQAVTPITGEVPAELVETIVADLSERIGAPRERIIVIHDQEVIWNDGSLGCPRPGEFYTQALVNGYWVLLEVDGARYDYRATATGYFFLCERGIPPGPPATPSS